MLANLSFIQKKLVKRIFNWLAHFITNRSILILFIIITLTIGFICMTCYLPTDFALENLLSVADDDASVFYNQFCEQFGNDEFITIAVTGDDIFSAGVMGMIHRVTEKLQVIKEVRRVLSLTNAENIFQHSNLPPEKYIQLQANNNLFWKRIKEAAITNPLSNRYLISADGRTTAIIIKTFHHLDSHNHRNDLIKKINTILDSEPDYQFFVAGDRIFNQAVAQQLKKYFAILPVMIFCLAFLIYIFFRNFLWIGVAILNTGLGIVWTTGILWLVGGAINLVTVTLIIFIIMLSTAFMIHFFSRYRFKAIVIIANQEHSGAGETKIDQRKQILQETWYEVVRPILMVGTSLVVASGSFLVSAIAPLQMVGLVMLTGILVTLIISLTFMPALLTLLPMPASKVTSRISTKVVVFFSRLANKESSPVPALMFILLIIAGWFALKQKIATINIDWFHHHTTLYRAYSFIDSRLAGVKTIEISIRSAGVGGIVDSRNLKDIQTLAEYITLLPGVKKVISITNYLLDTLPADDVNNKQYISRFKKIGENGALLSGDEINDFIDEKNQWTRMSVYLSTNNLAEIQQVIHNIRAYTIAAFDRAPLEFQITGKTYLTINRTNELVLGVIKQLVLVAGLLFVIMAVVYGSCSLSLLLLVPTLFIMITFLAIIRLVNISLNPITMVIYIIAVCFSMNDSVRLLYYYKKSKNRGVHTDQAIVEAVKITGNEILMTTMLLSIAFMFFLMVPGLKPIHDLGMLIPIMLANALVGNLIFLLALIPIFKPVKLKNILT